MKLPLIDGAILIDNSTLEKLSCPRKLQINWIDKLVKQGTSAGANFGSTIHRGLETRYKLCGTAAVQTEHILPINSSMLEWLEANPQPDAEFRNYGHACNMIQVYNQQYGQEQFKILTTQEGKLLVEASFMLPMALLIKVSNTVFAIEQWNGSEVEVDDHELKGLRVIKVYYTGKIDLGIEDTSGIWSFDHKTAFQFGDSFLQQMDMDAGQLGYMWALQQVTGKEARGYIIDAIRVRRPKKGDDLLGSTGCIDKTDFFRRPFFKSQSVLTEWRANVLQLILNIANMAEQDYFPMQRSQCISKYGACEYYDICNTPPEQRDLIKNSGNYVENKWSPLKPATESVE